MFTIKLEQLEFKLEKNLGFRNMHEKLEKKSSSSNSIFQARESKKSRADKNQANLSAASQFLLRHTVAWILFG